MNAPTIIAERLAEVTARGLKSGAHRNLAEGMCAMEAASYIAGEAWSDHPQCVSPVIAAFLRNWNDSLPDGERNALITPDLIALTIGTQGSAALEERRSLMAADWLVRTHTVAWLRLAKLDSQAALLAALPEITATGQVPSLRGPLEAVRKDAVAARAAARVAAWDVAWSAAWAAAEVAARAAARVAAWGADWNAARDVAWNAARDAAWNAAGAALASTKADLQASAGDLIRRMCALTDANLAVQA